MPQPAPLCMLLACSNHVPQISLSQRCHNQLSSLSKSAFNLHYDYDYRLAITNLRSNAVYGKKRWELAPVGDPVAPKNRLVAEGLGCIGTQHLRTVRMLLLRMVFKSEAGQNGSKTDLRRRSTFTTGL